MPRQLALDLTTPPALGRGDFLAAPSNALALSLLDRPQDWPQGLLLLVGPEGAGKSHLAAFWAAERGAQVLAAGTLPGRDPDALVSAEGALVVEDADRIAGDAGAEAALFHLWNLAAARGCLLLMTARMPPRDWPLGLPDLASRMAGTALVRLGAPDEALMAAVLVKLFADRQLVPGPDVIGALVRRMDRDLGLARRLVAQIDRAALAGRRAVTRPLALATLDALDRHRGDGPAAEASRTGGTNV